ncbi:ParB/RepB/Spo0J family partition protein [Kitasatospora sp. NPDC001527]|uniref:ParB/RepB/Spo0J family partition protein n=1 Tax=Kitasatospora sp. NPDC001527 TaxID=3154519 RepID=UPI0033272D6E
MSIAKKLQGGGGSFGALAQGGARGGEVLARSEALDATGRVRRASSAPVSAIVFNPLNPRRTIDDESIAELADSLGRQQIVPITVVSRGAFLDAHPGQAEAIGDADFVALDGNRRLLAAQRAGLESLRVDLHDDLISTASDMVEAALIANAHREDVSPLEEAQAIEQLLKTVYDGNQAAVARKLGKSKVWVGQRLALLHLTTELQEQASSGELAIADARRIGAEARAGKLTAAEQSERAEAAKKAAADRQAAKTAAKATSVARTPADGRAGSSESASPSGGGSESGEAREVNAVYPPASIGTPADGPTAPTEEVDTVCTASVPDQRESSADETPAVTVRLLPSDPRTSAQTILDAMGHRQAVQVASELLELLRRHTEPQPA